MMGQTTKSIIPEDWEQKSFSECIEKTSIPRQIKIPQGQYQRAGEYPIVDQGADFIAGYTNDKLKLYSGQLPVIVFGDHTRIFKYVDFAFSLGADGTKLIRPKKFLNPQYFYYYLSGLSLESKGYNRHYKYLKENLISFPEMLEQRKISHILLNIKNAIEQQEKIIAKTKELKRSLMHQLFTRGLRREELKETEIGMIPKSWDVKPAEDICKRVTDGTHDSPKPAEAGHYLVTSKNLKEGKILFDGCYLIKESDYLDVNKRSKVDLHDVVFGMIGTLGSPVIIRNEPDFAIKNVGLFKTDRDKNLGLWLYYYLSSDFVERLVDKQKAGATQKYIPLWFLRQMPVLVPPEKERNEIINILENISLKSDAEESRLIILKSLFKTMLNNLMTGQVRVKDVDFGEINV